MKKLWKVTVNNWGWDRPATYYAESKEAAQQIYNKYPAADKVEYAGNFADKTAARLLGAADD